MKDAKVYIIYVHTYTIFWKRQNDTDRKQIGGCQGPQKGVSKYSEDEWLFYMLIAVVVMWLFINVKNSALKGWIYGM